MLNDVPRLHVKTLSLLSLVPGSQLEIQDVFKRGSFTTTLILPQKMIRQSICLAATSTKTLKSLSSFSIKKPPRVGTLCYRDRTTELIRFVSTTNTHERRLQSQQAAKGFIATAGSPIKITLRVQL